MHAGNRCWQIMTSRPRGTVNPANEMNKEDPTQSIHVWLQPFTVNPEDLEAHVLAHSSERANSDSEGDASKVEMQKTEAQCSCLLPQKPKEIYSLMRKVWWLDNSRAQNPQRRMWISEQSLIRCRGTSARHPVESVSQKPSQKPKVVNTNNSENFGKHCEELSWYHRKTTLHRSENERNCRTSCTSSERRDISCIIAIWIGW